MFLFLFTNLLFSQIKKFPTSFYGRWLPLSNEKIFTENKFNWYRGTNSNYLNRQNFPIIIEVKDGLYISINADAKYYFISKLNIKFI